MDSNVLNYVTNQNACLLMNTVRIIIAIKQSNWQLKKKSKMKP